MKPNSDLRLAIALSLLIAADAAGAIEIAAGTRTPGGSANSYATGVGATTVAGVVTTINGKAGFIVLDGTRRFDFDPATLVVRRQNNQGGLARLSDVGAGTRASLTVLRKGTNDPARVSEVWISP